MFCINCGNKLPEGSKFCPNCGARILTEITGAAAETAEVLESAEEAVAERVEEIMETAEELAGNAGETAADAVDDAAQAAEEAAGTAEAVFDEAAGAAEETAEKAADAFEEVLEETAGTVEETAEAVTETVENTFGETAEAADEAADFVEETAEEAAEAVGETVEAVTAAAEDTAEEAAEAVDSVADAIEETAEEAAEKVEEALDEVTGAIEETAEDAAGAAGDAPAEAAGAVALAADQAVEEAEEVIRSADETAEQTTEAAAGFTSDVEAVLTTEVPGSLPDAPADTVPETAAAEVSPFASQPVTAAENKAPKKKRTGLKVFLALLLIAALAVGGYFVYQNLPAQKVKRYKEAASEAIAAGDLLEASVQYKNALDIEPADEESISALLMMHNMIRQDAVDAAQMGLYAEAVEQMKLANSILIEPEEKNLQDLADIYFEWVGVLAYSGDEDKANTVLASAKADGISADNISLIEENMKRFSNLHRIEAAAEELTDTIVATNGGDKYEDMFSILIGMAPEIASYQESFGGILPIVCKYDNGNKAVIWRYSKDRDSIQFYIGDITGDSVENGIGDLYFYRGLSGSTVSYEYFSSEWVNGTPNGAFQEITFDGAPDSFAEEDCGYVSGNVKDGHYDGDIRNKRSGGHTFNMKFDNGKVIVLDTVDPNGEECNVVGYTDDQNTWITMNDDRLNGTYGLRYLVE